MPLSQFINGCKINWHYYWILGHAGIQVFIILSSTDYQAYYISLVKNCALLYICIKWRATHSWISFSFTGRYSRVLGVTLWILVHLKQTSATFFVSQLSLKWLRETVPLDGHSKVKQEINLKHSHWDIYSKILTGCLLWT